MQKRNNSIEEAGIERVKAELERWRETRKAGERIPASLWKAAVDLTSHYSINQVSRRLRLSYTDLKKRVHDSSQQGVSNSEFIELDTAGVFCTGECIIEMHRRDGSTMKVSFRGGMGCDLIELGKAFWKEQS